MTIFDIEHHEGDVLIVVVEFLWFVAELSPDLDDAVEGLVGDHSLEPDIQLQEGSRVTAVQSNLEKKNLWNICCSLKKGRPDGDQS